MAGLDARARSLLADVLRMRQRPMPCCNRKERIPVKHSAVSPGARTKPRHVLSCSGRDAVVTARRVTRSDF
eukprot:5902341-Prymnesium_polylepis.1